MNALALGFMGALAWRRRAHARRGGPLRVFRRGRADRLVPVPPGSMTPVPCGAGASAVGRRLLVERVLELSR